MLGRVRRQGKCFPFRCIVRILGEGGREWLVVASRRMLRWWLVVVNTHSVAICPTDRGFVQGVCERGGGGGGRTQWHGPPTPKDPGRWEGSVWNASLILDTDACGVAWVRSTVLLAVPALELPSSFSRGEGSAIVPPPPSSGHYTFTRVGLGCWRPF
jgi:hypothetical protein